MSNTIKDKAERGSVISTILEILKTGDKYGYEIIKEVEEKSGIELKQPSLYSCLTRLESQGIISSYWQDSDIGGRRHYYKLNVNDNTNDNAINNVNKTNPSPIQVIVLNNIENIIVKCNNNNNLNIETYCKTDKHSNIDIINNNDNISNVKLDKIETLMNSSVNNISYKIETFNKNNQEEQPIKTKSIQQLLEEKSTENNNIIKNLTNIILAHKEQIRLEQEKEQEKNFDITTLNNFKESNVTSNINNNKQSYIEQQSLDLDNASKKYLNNVLLETVSKTNKTSENKKIMKHYTTVGDLTDAYIQNNIEVKEFSYTNYNTINSNKYISNIGFFAANFIEMIIYIVLSIISSKTNLFNLVNVSFIFLSIIQASFCVELFIITFKPKFRFLKHNIFALITIALLKTMLSVAVLFIVNKNIFNSFSFEYILLLLPILFIMLPILFEKKAEKF